MSNEATLRIPAAAPLAQGAALSPRFLETFRLLALNMQLAIEGQALRAIVVLSARHGDGRSLAALSLASALAELGHRVALINADPLGRGFVDANGHLSGGRPGGQVEMLSPNGTGHDSTTSYVREVQALLQTSVRAGALAVVDTPPCSVSSAGFSIAAAGAGVIYVARRRADDPGVHRDIRAELDLLGATILGVVYNDLR